MPNVDGISRLQLGRGCVITRITLATGLAFTLVLGSHRGGRGDDPAYFLKPGIRLDEEVGGIELWRLWLCSKYN